MNNENSVGPILGIDLGTTNSLAALFENDQAKILKKNDDGIVPSVVTYLENGKVLVGREALANFSNYPESTVYSAKRFFGKTFAELGDELDRLPFKVGGDERSLKFEVHGRQIAPLEVSAEVLRNIRERAADISGEDINRAVITVPAYFDDTQRQETRTAAIAAGLQVERIINEPTAAALAYGIDLQKEGKIAVYDLGGGTFDISILDLKEGVFKVLATRGDTFLGGDDFDHALVDLILSKANVEEESLQDNAALKIALKFAAEEVKKRLSDKLEVPLSIELPEQNFSYEGQITRAEFEQSIRSLVKRSLRCCKTALKDSGINDDEITQVVLVGGSTRVPLVRQMVQDYFEKIPYVGLNPDEVVALGAAVQGQILNGGKRDVLLLDVVPLSLGLETLGGAVTKVLLRNTTIPVSATEDFTTSVDNQTGIVLHVLQGERELVEDCRSLGRFNVKVPPMPAGLPKLRVTFTVDENGMLRVDAFEERSSHKASIEIAPTIGLSQTEMERIVEDSIENAMDDFQLRMVVELRNKAERIVVATERVYDRAYKLMSREHVDEIKVWVAKAKEALQRGEKNQAVLEEIVDHLGDLTRPLADLLFNQATTEALVGKTVADV